MAREGTREVLRDTTRTLGVVLSVGPLSSRRNGGRRGGGNGAPAMNFSGLARIGLGFLWGNVEEDLGFK